MAGSGRPSRGRGRRATLLASGVRVSARPNGRATRRRRARLRIPVPSLASRTHVGRTTPGLPAPKALAASRKTAAALSAFMATSTFLVGEAVPGRGGLRRTTTIWATVSSARGGAPSAKTRKGRPVTQGPSASGSTLGTPFGIFIGRGTVGPPRPRTGETSAVGRPSPSAPVGLTTGNGRASAGTPGGASTSRQVKARHAGLPVVTRLGTTDASAAISGNASTQQAEGTPVDQVPVGLDQQLRTERPRRHRPRRECRELLQLP